MSIVKRGLLAATILTGALAAIPAEAATFLFTFSGAALGNGATATGSFDLADAALAAINSNTNPAYGSVSDLKMTISGAGAGNGLFTNANFVSMFFHSTAPLDFTRELVGQKLANGAIFGQSSLSGDFNFFSGAQASPTGYNSFTLGAYRGLSSKMALTSLISATAVPEPASWAMLILGVGAVGFAMRRRRNTTTRVTFAA